MDRKVLESVSAKAKLEEAYVIERAELQRAAMKLFGLSVAMHAATTPASNCGARETWRRRMLEAEAIVRSADRL